MTICDKQITISLNKLSLFNSMNSIWVAERLYEYDRFLIYQTFEQKYKFTKLRLFSHIIDSGQWILFEIYQQYCPNWKNIKKMFIISLQFLWYANQFCHRFYGIASFTFIMKSFFFKEALLIWEGIIPIFRIPVQTCMGIVSQAFQSIWVRYLLYELLNQNEFGSLAMRWKFISTKIVGNYDALNKLRWYKKELKQRKKRWNLVTLNQLI